MKHTKKMVMVPESEYLALISLIKKGTATDPYESEKAGLDAHIQKNLADHKTGADVQMKRHSWLYKQRRQLKNLVENRPQKVVIENMSAIQPNIAPYMGIQNSPSTPKVKSEEKNESKADDYMKYEIEKDNSKIYRHRKKTARFGRTKRHTQVQPVGYFSNDSGGEDSEEHASFSSARENLDDEHVTIATPKIRRRKSILPLTQQHKTSAKHYDGMLKLVEKNFIRYGIDTQSGEILTNFNKRVAGSSYTDSLKFLTGQLNTKPKGYKFFLQRLNRDADILKFFSKVDHQQQQQTGEGKKRISGWKKKIIAIARMSSNTIKTPDLRRQKDDSQQHKPTFLPNQSSQSKFKPVLWAKL